MAAGNWIVYNSAREYLMDGTIDLDTHTFKVMLTTDTYTPSASHTVKTDVTNEIANGNGYTTGGATLGSVTWAHSGTTATFDAANPAWTASGGSIATIKNAVIYDDTAASDELLCYCVLDASTITVTDGNTFTINLNASGILTLSGASS